MQNDSMHGMGCMQRDIRDACKGHNIRDAWDIRDGATDIRDACKMTV